MLLVHGLLATGEMFDPVLDAFAARLDVDGMNFDYMPELHWALGYPLALVLMVLVSATLYQVFKNRGWL